MVDGTLAEAVEALAKRAVDLQSRPASYAERERVKCADFLSGIGQFLQNNPTASHGLLGAGLGAGIGGLSTAWSNRGKDEMDRRSVLSSALTGGLAGGAMGGGIGLARQALGAQLPEAKVSPGQYTTGDNQKMQIDPETLKANPGLVNKVRDLTGPSAPMQQGINAIGGGLHSLWSSAPITGTMAGIAAPIDFALHNPVFGLSKVDPTRVGGSVGRTLLSRGASASKDLSERLKGIIMGNERPYGSPIDPAAVGPHLPNDYVNTPGRTPKPDQGVLDILGGGKKTPRGGAHSVLETEHRPMEEVKSRTADPTDKTLFHESVRKQHGAPKRETLSASTLGELKAEGLEGSRFAERNLYQTPGTRHSYAGFKTMPRAIGSRAAMYGPPVLGEMALRSMATDVDRHKQLREIIGQYAKPVSQQ